MPLLQIKKFAIGRIVTALGFFLALWAIIAIVAPRIENLVRDVMMTTVSPFNAPPRDIVVVTITEQTLEQFPYRSPIDRGFIADLVQRIDGARPLAIGIDLLLDQPTELAKDARLAGIIESAESPVIIASGSQEDDLTEKQLAYLDRFAPQAIRGLVALLRDRVDGVVRESFPGRAASGGWQPGFAPALAMAAGLPVPQTREKMIYYRNEGFEPAKFTTYPAHAVAFAPRAWFSGKFVLIGVDLPLQDRHLTPFAVLNGSVAGALPGVLIHANTLAKLVNGDHIIEPSLLVTLMPFVLALVLCGWIAWRPMSVIMKPVAILIIVAAMLIAEVAVFAWYGIILPMVVPAMLIIALSSFVAVLAWQRDSRERRFIQNAFSQYLSPTVVTEIVKKPALLRLGGSQRVVTCVFTDLEGFTSFSERTQPETLAAILNEYLDLICGLFIEHGATIDKLIGDAVVGFFGAPGEQPDQTKKALALTLAIGALSRRFRKDLNARGHNIGSTRIGVHRGQATVGNFGGNRFFNYTAMGDTMNTAARLEGANKYLGTANCVSEAAARDAGNCLLRRSGDLYLKGKIEVVRAFEVLEDTETNRQMVKVYAQAYQLMSMRSADAKAAFESLVDQYPHDGLIAFHLGRLNGGEAGDAVYLESK